MTKELKLGSDSETQNALTSSQGRNKGLNTLGLAARCCNTFTVTSENLLWKSLSPWQNFFTTTCLTNSVWFDFMQCVAGTIFYCGDQDFYKKPQYTRSNNLLLRHVTTNCGSDLSSLCVALTCQLVCSDLKPITAYRESRALNTLQC